MGELASPDLLGTLCARRRLVRRGLHAPHLRACAISRTPDIPFASACLSYLSPISHTPRRPYAATPDFQRRPWSRSSLSVDSMPEDLLMRVGVPAMVLVGMAGRPLVRHLWFFAPGMKCAETFALWWTSPCTLPQLVARLRKFVSFRSP